MDQALKNNENVYKCLKEGFIALIVVLKTHDT